MTKVREDDIVGFIMDRKQAPVAAIVTKVGAPWPNPLARETAIVQLVLPDGDRAIDVSLFASEDEANAWLDKVASEGGSAFAAFEFHAQVKQKMQDARRAVVEEHVGEIRKRHDEARKEKLPDPLAEENDIPSQAEMEARGLESLPAGQSGLVTGKKKK